VENYENGDDNNNWSWYCIQLIHKRDLIDRTLFVEKKLIRNDENEDKEKEEKEERAKKEGREGEDAEDEDDKDDENDDN